jgi:glycyl-tRNA synthetase
MNQPSLDALVAFAKRRGFVFGTSDIYGGLANSYDYGPYGAQLLKNIKDLWWKTFVCTREDMVGLDSQIIQHPTTWVASGHVGSFNDPLVEDKKTHKRYRADHLIEAWIQEQIAKGAKQAFDRVEDMKIEEMAAFIKENGIRSPDGNELTEPKPFNLLFETALGTVAGEKSKVYLRGETAQGIFANFKNIMDTMRVKLPFGVGQIGKSFRNEITQGQFVFRTFEFEQAEIEYFFDPEISDWEQLMETWKEAMMNFVTQKLGVTSQRLRWRRHTDKERSHYSKDTYDLDYKFPFGWKELWGIAYRTDYDLKQHMKHSGKSLEYVDSRTGRTLIPHVIEPAVGVNRLFLMVLADAYTQEDLKDGKTRTVLRLKPWLSPVKVAVFPLQKDDRLRARARRLYEILVWNIEGVEFDNTGNIGKMYRRQDEIGTPFCVTVDYETLSEGKVTVRKRDTMTQDVVSEQNLLEYLQNALQT